MVGKVISEQQGMREDEKTAEDDREIYALKKHVLNT
jgi:hypothetical protein